MANPNLFSTATTSALATTILASLSTAQVAVLTMSTGQVAKLYEVTIANLTTASVTALGPVAVRGAA